MHSPLSALGKQLGAISAVQMDFCQIAFQSRHPLKQNGSSFIFSQFFKTAVLSLPMDILTMSMVKHYFRLKTKFSAKKKVLCGPNLQSNRLHRHPKGRVRLPNQMNFSEKIQAACDSPSPLIFGKL